MPDEPSDTRASILQTAQQLIAQEGVHALTLERVAREAGLSKGGLLYHFGNKEQLIEAFVDRLVSRLEHDRTEWERTPDRGTQSLLSSVVGCRGGQLLTALLAALGNKPKLLDPLREHYQERQRLLEREAPDPVGAVVALLAAEGLVLCEELGLIALSPEKRDGVVRRILASTENNKEMREESELIQPARVMQPAESLATAQAELHQLGLAAREAARVAADALGSLQDPSGFWRGDLTADTTLESDYVLLMLWLYPADGAGWNPPGRARIHKAMARILDNQLPDGGWSIYVGGPSELNATARAYAALKIGGMDPHHPALVRARKRVLALGGLQAANSYTKINLSLFGLFPRQFTPSVPPELVMIPGNLLYEMSSWTRAIIVPLSIVQASGIERPAPPGLTLEELYLPGQELKMPKKDRLSAVFNQADRAIKLWERRGVKDIRAKAIREAEKWMLERTRFSDGLGAIYPSMMYSIMAMDALGYERDQPDLVEAIRQFESLILETEDRLQFQPCVSPVWDTAIALFALGELGEGRDERKRRAADWLLQKEVRRKGDWSVKRPALAPGGWAFEFANEYYPDIDDTAMVLLALGHVQASDPERQHRAERRAIQWLLGMQSSDGGWAAFDVDNNWQLLNKVPFADHNAMLDPTCPDITGRVLEALCRRGRTCEDPAIARAVQYLVEHQKEDGSWYGRWGVNYVYGTFLALRGLRASGSRQVQQTIDRASAWLRSVQNPDGGWGESCASYDTHCFVRAASTASQTAWGLLGLAAGGDSGSASVRRGIAWLLEHRNAAGVWDEPFTTGTGFPNVFYLTYHLYRHYFPLLALAVWQARLAPNP